MCSTYVSRLEFLLGEPAETEEMTLERLKKAFFPNSSPFIAEVELQNGSSGAGTANQSVAHDKGFGRHS